MPRYEQEDFNPMDIQNINTGIFANENLKKNKMKTYLGVKLIEAEPMNKGEAWNRDLVKVDTTSELSQTEFDNLYKTGGYKVIYEDGYESWSPKNVFDKAYKEVKDFGSVKEFIAENDMNFKAHELRVCDEAWDLDSKIQKLDSFLSGNHIEGGLSDNFPEQNRLKQQLMAMQYYLTILVEQIENFK